MTQPLGLRYYRIDPDKGFFLNGKHLPLHGVCRHQDRSEVGNALRPQHHEEDVALMLEMGVNAVRLAHYPQATYFYDLMDKNGIIVWAEIPFIGPGGYDDKGFVNLPSFRANGKEQLKELIRQHFNHPSICVWGLFNELLEFGDNPVEYIKELNELAHQEDTTRPTTSASNQMGDLNFITDAIAWNRYDGWYGGTPADLGRWLDGMHRDHPEIRIAISEYGAGASIYHQQDSLVKSVPNSWWHPENWQTYYHIENWKAISARPYIWLISVRLTVRKVIVRELMIRGWLPLTGKYVKTRSTFIRLTGTRKNLCFIWPENVTPYVPDVCKRLLHSLISPGRNCLSMEKAMVRQCRISMLFWNGKMWSCSRERMK